MEQVKQFLRAWKALGAIVGMPIVTLMALVFMQTIVSAASCWGAGYNCQRVYTTMDAIGMYLQVQEPVKRK